MSHIQKEFEYFYNQMHPAEEDSEEGFVWLTGLPVPFLNGVFRLKAKDLSKKVDDILSKTNGTPLSFYITSPDDPLIDVLKEKGFKSAVVLPSMTWTTKPVTKPQHTLKVNENDFQSILPTVFGLDNVVKKGYIKLLDNLNIENFVVYLEDKPVGVGSLVINDKIGLISNVGVLPEHQKKGCGRSIMLKLMNRASELGLDKLILMSSPAGLKMYSDLGFTKSLNYEMYTK